MLLITEALLLILATLGQDHRAAATYPLDMAPTSVDDQYVDCTKQMAILVEKKYLSQELKNHPFGKAWQEGEEKYKALKDKDIFIRHVFIAIHVYTNYALEVYKIFNSDSRNGKDNYKKKTYKWYSLNFLLTKAIQVLKKTENKCYKTYRGINVEFDEPSREIRLGSFSSSSLDRTVAEGFGNKSCFEIYTCHGANVTMFSKHPEQKEVLIPPYEKFNVTAVKRRSEYKDLWCETVYTLQSSGTKSDLNCALIEEGAKL